MKPRTTRAALLTLGALGISLTVTLVLVSRITVEQGTVPVTTAVSGNGPISTEDAMDLAPADDISPLWEAVDEASVDPLPYFSTRWSVDGRVLVSVTTAASRAVTWRIGDRLTVPLPQLGTVYRPLIDNIDDGPGPTRSALGEGRSDDGRRRRVVVTVGPAHVLAYIDTPRGPYELVGGSEYGWLLPTSSMLAGFDAGEPDYVLPAPRTSAP